MVNLYYTPFLMKFLPLARNNGLFQKNSKQGELRTWSFQGRGIKKIKALISDTGNSRYEFKGTGTFKTTTQETYRYSYIYSIHLMYLMIHFYVEN